MIINGGSRSNGAFFAKHLTNGEHNERVTVCEMRNLAATTIPAALREMQAVAMGTQCWNYFYHANLNPREGELLTPEQWTLSVDTLERYLALVGHARFVVEHTKQGRTHRHVIWSRIDIRKMRAAVMTDDYEKHQAAARELEQSFGHPQVDSVAGRARAGGPRPARRPKAWESFRGQTTGIDPLAMKETLTRLFHGCATGAEFAAKLSEQGYQVVKGRRTDFCILDAVGHLHSLQRRLEGVSAATVQEFLKDVPTLLPPDARVNRADTEFA